MAKNEFKVFTYMFKTESEVFLSGNFDSMFECKKNQHPDILKKHLQNAITIETMVILDIILGYTRGLIKKWSQTQCGKP